MAAWAATDGSEVGPRGVSRMVGQVAEERPGGDRGSLAALQDIAADEGRVRHPGLSGPPALAGMDLRRQGLHRRVCRRAVDPVDLWAKFDPPTLPRGVLPEVIEAFAFDRGMTMGCDMAGIAVSALAVCAAAIPDSIKLQPKKHDTEWQESARLWVALVGSPSTMKTPMMDAAAKPLRRIDNEMARDNQDAMDDCYRLPKEEQKKTSRQSRPGLMMQDTTIEAAQEILKDSPNGVLSYQDELSGWFGVDGQVLRREGAPQKDRAFWLRDLQRRLIHRQTASGAGPCSSRTSPFRCWAASSPSRSASLPRTATTTGSCSG